MNTTDTQKNQRSGSSIPAYQRIEEDIRKKVREGELPVGTMLAGRHNLAKEYGVALSTVQQAIANLISEGLLETSDRRGTFVATHRLMENEDAASESLLPHWTNRGTSADLLRDAAVMLPQDRFSATLGIVSTSRIDAEGSQDIGSLWSRLAMRSLENVFSASGGTMHYFDRYPEHLGPYASGFADPNAIPMSEAIAALQSQGVEALAIFGLCDSRDMSDEIMAAVDVERVPTVYLSWHELRPPLAQVYYDSRFAGYQAAQHLLRKGYRRLLTLAPFMENWLTERIIAVRDAIRYARIPSDALRVYPTEPTHQAYDRDRADEWAYIVAKQVFAEDWIFAQSKEWHPWGIIAPNDNTAYAVLRAATELGKEAGKDYGLVGFDDDFRSSFVGLTTVRPPVEAMGEEAGRLLLRTLQGEKSGLQVRLRSQVIPRASTALRSGASTNNRR